MWEHGLWMSKLHRWNIDWRCSIHSSAAPLRPNEVHFVNVIFCAIFTGSRTYMSLTFTLSRLRSIPQLLYIFLHTYTSHYSLFISLFKGQAWQTMNTTVYLLDSNFLSLYRINKISEKVISKTKPHINQLKQASAIQMTTYQCHNLISVSRNNDKLLS